jgi:hypothetical protein
MLRPKEGTKRTQAQVFLFHQLLLFELRTEKGDEPVEEIHSSSSYKSNSHNCCKARARSTVSHSDPSTGKENMFMATAEQVQHVDAALV